MTDERQPGGLDVFIRRAHQEAATSALAGGVAHYFNNLLGGILGLVTLAPSLGREDLVGLCGRLHVQVEEASLLTRTLLSLTRRGKWATTGDVTDVIARTRELALLAHACGGSAAAVTAELPKEPLWVAVPPPTFSECLMPLLVAAAQAAGIARPGEGSVEVRVWAEGDVCVIRLDDNGPPLPPDDGSDLQQLVDAGEVPTSRRLALAAAATHLRDVGGSLTRHATGCELRLPRAKAG